MRLRHACLVLSCSLCLIITGCGKKPESTTAQSSPELTELTGQVRRYSFEKRKLPANLGELVAAGYIKNVPPAPAGKAFAIDAERAEVVLVNK